MLLMNKKYNRFAIYFMPQSESLFYDLGIRWFGWDPLRGSEVNGLHNKGTDEHLLVIEKARKYGLHATLKAPFRLRKGCELDDLISFFQDTCTRYDGCIFNNISIKKISDFIAITPNSDTTKIHSLAADIVKEFDQFRDELNESDIEKRNLSSYSLRQKEYFYSWGYPYVFEEFKFHMTLGKLSHSKDGTAEEKICNEYFQEIISKPMKIDNLCLMGEDQNGMFHILENTIINCK
jgi:hypothetical protein